MPALFRHRHTAHKPWLAALAWLALVWMVVVVQAGGFTTSIGAGMAFLDWPLSNGSLNPEGWLIESHKFAEHSHRLGAGIAGMLALGLAISLFLCEARRWLRTTGWFALVLVVIQAVLGGLRVRLDALNTGAEDNFVATVFRVAHGVTAQVYVCVLVTIALALTRRWIESTAGLRREPSAALRWAGLIATAAIVIQLVLGAIMRHNHAGLAIPTFPLAAEGSLLPAAWSFGVTVHFAHRAWALVVAAALVVFAGRLWGARHLNPRLPLGATALMALLSIQIFLGALIIWKMRNPHAATMHVLTGAFLLATCWGLTFLCHRFRFAEAAPRPAEEASIAVSRRPTVLQA